MPPLHSPTPEPARRITKDQERARRAYEQVTAVDASKREDYEIAVRTLGANIVRSGLSAALADLMRRGSKAKELRQHIAASRIPGLTSDNQESRVLQDTELCRRVNELDVGEYMLATRETLQVVMWLKRACQATSDATQEGNVPAVKDGTGNAS